MKKVKTDLAKAIRDTDAIKTIEDIHCYLSGWRDSERWSDLNLMLDKGLVELAALSLVNYGAIDSTVCYDDFASTERAVEQLVDGYSESAQKQDWKEFWKYTSVWVGEGNEHAFINSKIHFVDDCELKSWGFKKQRM